MVWFGFLRGVNLGKRNIKMDALRAAFAALGYPGTQTLIASGNVLIPAHRIDEAAIEKGLEETFGFPIAMVTRSLDEMRELVASDPFGAFPADADIKRYVTFSKSEVAPGLEKVVPDPSDFEIVRADDRQFFVVGHARPNGRYGEKLDQLEKIFRNQVITMRNWNTIGRMLARAEQMADA